MTRLLNTLHLAMSILVLTLLSTTTMASSPRLGKRDVAGWSAMGCHSDSRTNRTLRSETRTLAQLTIDNCLYECQNTGFLHAGLTNGTECWCDLAVQGAARAVDESSCNLPCAGSSGIVERCGGELAIDLYSYRPAIAAGATAVPRSVASPTSVSSTTRTDLPRYRQ